MKILYTLLLLALFHPIAIGQFSLEGIALKNFSKFEKGDTVNIIGISKSHIYGHPLRYITGPDSDMDYVYSNRVRILNEDIPFWDSIWFWNMSEDYYQKDGFKNHFQAMERQFQSRLNQWKDNDLIMKNDLMSEYLYRLLFRLSHGSQSNSIPVNMRILLIKSTEPFITSYSSGIIILSTALLAECKSEKDLANKLTGEIAKIRLIYDYGDRASNEQEYIMRECQEAQLHFMENYYPGLKETSDTLYHIYLNEAGKLYAWDLYHNYQFQESLDLLYRLEQYALLTEDEYLLKSYLYRKLFNTPAKNLEALIFLEKAIDMSGGSLIDLYLERAMVYKRLENYKRAERSLMKYIEGLNKLEESGYDMSEKKQMAKDFFKSVKLASADI
jgi:hypothetical protein